MDGTVQSCMNVFPFLLLLLHPFRYVNVCMVNKVYIFSSMCAFMSCMLVCIRVYVWMYVCMSYYTGLLFLYVCVCVSEPLVLPDIYFNPMRV